MTTSRESQSRISSSRGWSERTHRFPQYGAVPIPVQPMATTFLFKNSEWASPVFPACMPQIVGELTCAFPPPAAFKQAPRCKRFLDTRRHPVGHLLGQANPEDYADRRVSL